MPRGHIAKHAMNVEIYPKNGAGVGEQSINQMLEKN